MITSRDLDNQVVSSTDLEQRRGPGRRPVEPRVVTSVKLPEPLYDEYCRASLASGESVHALFVKAIETYRQLGELPSEGEQPNGEGRRRGRPRSAEK